MAKESIASKAEDRQDKASKETSLIDDIKKLHKNEAKQVKKDFKKIVRVGI